MRQRMYVLVVEGSNSPLDSSKGLSEQKVMVNSTLRLVKKSDLPKSDPVVKRVITMIDKGTNQSKEYEYDDNKTVNEYRLLLWNEIGVKVTSMRLKTYVVVIEGTKDKQENSFYYDYNSTLADLRIKPKDTLYVTIKEEAIFSYRFIIKHRINSTIMSMMAIRK